MIINFIKVAFRNMKKYKTYTLVNLLGLAIGLACVFLIFLYVQDELSYDQFYPKHENVYRIVTHSKMGDRVGDFNTTSAPLAPTAVADFPEIKYGARVVFRSNKLFIHKDKKFLEDSFLRTDSTFFKIFPRPFIYGNPETALRGNNIVLTQSTSEKYFGNRNPIGETLQLEGDKLYIVSGVIEDLPHNSHFHYDLIAMLHFSADQEDDWFSDYMQTYFRLEEGADFKALEEKLPDFSLKYFGPKLKEAFGIDVDTWLKSGNEFRYYLEPLSKIYLHTKARSEVEPMGDIKYVYLFSLVALLILILACINFMNLTTARSFTRSKEVGIRKVFGTNRTRLIFQFYTEVLLMTVIASFIAFFIVELFIPYFNQLSQKELSTFLLFKGVHLLYVVGIILFVVVFAGTYSALSLSNFSLMSVLRKEIQKGRKGKFMRLSLVVFQFWVAVVILVSSLVIQQQVNFMQNKKIGFDKERVMIVDRAYRFSAEERASLKENLLRNPQIERVSYSGMIPGRGTNGWSMFGENSGMEDMINFRLMSIDNNFIDLLNLELIHGQLDLEKFVTQDVYIANESAMKILGYEKQPEGRVVYRPNIEEGTRETIEIMGVVKDFHFGSMKDEIQPLFLYSSPRSYKRYMLIKCKSSQLIKTQKEIEKRWNKMTNNEPFVYFFLDDDFNKLFKNEVRIANLLKIFTILAFFIALLGLIGLVSFEMRQRVKEICVRKVLGSTNKELIFVLSKSLCLSVVWSNLLAWPVTYYLMHQWLSNFAYRIDFPWYYLALAFLISILMTLIIVVGHSVNAMKMNPGTSLRYE